MSRAVTQDSVENRIRRWLIDTGCYAAEDDIEINALPDEWDGDDGWRGEPWGGHWVFDVWEGDANDCYARGDEARSGYVHPDGRIEGLY